MRRYTVSILLTLLFAADLAAPAHAQVADTLFTWRGYTREATCHIRVYHSAEGVARPHTVVLQELAENNGPAILTDARYLAELVGRSFGIDPTQALWVFHYGSFSYAGAAPDKGKEIFLKATFSRTKSNNLASPSWQLVTREVVEDYTDRLFR